MPICLNMPALVFFYRKSAAQRKETKTMKKMIAVLMSVALVAVLAVPALAAEPFYANEETSPYDNCQGNRSCPMWYFAVRG